MFPVTITLNNQTQLNAVLAALNIEPPAVVKEAVTPVEKPAKATAAKTAEPATSQPTAEAEVAVAPGKIKASPAPSPTTPPADVPCAVDEVTYQDAATALTKLARVKGRDAAISVLKSFGAANLKEVKPEQFAAVLAATNKALEG